MPPLLPEPVNRSYSPFQVDDAGWWLVLSDVHIPYHDPMTIALAIRTARKYRVAGVLLNGDVLDSHELSTFDRDPSAPRYVQEVQAARQFLVHLRYQLPNARIVFKAGNHEERLERYLMRKAPALFGLDGVTLPSILRLDDLGIEFVGDKRVIRLGRLNILHGHEYRPGISVPVNPARGVFLRAKSVVLCGHWHQTSEHHEPTISGKPQGAWSTGCACQLAPAYAPLNKWNSGFALVRLDADGGFSVRNLRVFEGEVV